MNREKGELPSLFLISLHPRPSLRIIHIDKGHLRSTIGTQYTQGRFYNASRIFNKEKGEKYNCGEDAGSVERYEMRLEIRWRADR